MISRVSRGMFLLLMSFFLGTSTFFWSLAPAAAFQLPYCQPVKQRLSLQKDGCSGCHMVETTVCSGHCFTKDPLMKIRPMQYQNVCTYRDFYYKTFELPDCLPGVDPTVSYPVALSCHCGACIMNTSDCTFESLPPDFCMKHESFYY
ncbi:lutropin subunit beta [Oryzias melastigma]|uniref:Gonadotropin subunit beta-2 n=2 Tax=Oryzias melastigma TaxID=30732 RepID=A0A3B3CCK7_ORYME|nr:lutropin subunit beta [Oryzias melastigma]